MRLIRHVTALFQVQSGEAGLVALLVLYSAAAAGGVWTIGFNGVGQALFLSRLPASDVPFTFILPAAVIVLTLAGYSRLAARLSLPLLAAGSSALLLLLAVGFRVLLALGYGRSFGVLAGIYLYCEAAGSLVLVQFWTFAGQVYNPRQARRLFGLIAAGGTLASAAAGLVLALLTRLLGVDNLILIVAGSSGVCGACALLLRKYVSTTGSGRDQPARQDVGRAKPALLDDLRDLWRTPLLRSIGLITVLGSLLINIGAYQFFLVLHSTYSGKSAALAGFLGAFAIWTGLAALALQVFGTGPLMVRFGALATQAIFPIAMAAAAGATILVWGALWAVAVTRGLDPAFRRTVHDASLNALYLPLPAEQRRRARAVLEGVYAVSFGLAGAGFLLVQRVVPAWTYQYWSIPVLLLAACWVALLYPARRRYITALARSIDQRRLSFDTLIFDLADDTTAEVLARALQRSDDRVVIHVLGLIAAAPGQAWLPHVAPLLAHPSAPVRVAALRCLARADDGAYVDSVAGLLTAPEDEVAGAAIAALAGLLGSEAIVRVAPLLADDRPSTAGAAVIVLLASDEGVWRRRAAERLRAMLESGAPALRRAAARALGQAGLDADSCGPLREFAGSELPPSASPIQVAIACLIRLLTDKETRDAAADGLTHQGPIAVPALGTLLDDRAQAGVVRSQAAAILQRIGGQAAAEALLGGCGDPDSTVSRAAAHALAELCRREPTIGIDAPRLEARIMAESAVCYRLHIAAADLQQDGKELPLTEALIERRQRHLDLVFSLLQARYPGHDLARAHAAATSADEGERALAVELLDSTVDRRLAGLVVPLVEASAGRVSAIAAQQFGISHRSAAGLIAEFCHSDDPWLRACAVFTIGRAPDPQLTPLALAALSAEDDLVRETALAACRRFLPPKRFAEVALAQSDTTAFPMTRRYARALLPGVGAV